MIDSSIDKKVHEIAAGKAHLDTWQAEEIVKHYTRVFIAPDEQLFTCLLYTSRPVPLTA